jgi:hypothetical protein
MRAANKPRINLENQRRLEVVILLSTPFLLFVDPAGASNFRCVFALAATVN